LTSVSMNQSASNTTGNAIGSLTPTQVRAELQGCVDSARSLQQKACKHLQGDLDSEQIQLFELAFSEAELTACAVVLKELETQPDNSLLLLTGRFFVAQTLQNQLSRLAERPGDYGLSGSDLTAAFATSCCDVLAGALDSEALVALGTAFVESNGEPAGANRRS